MITIIVICGLNNSSRAQVGLKFFKDYYECSYGVIDTFSGDTLFEPQFTNYSKRGNHYIVNKNGAYGLINAKTGKIVVECEYSGLKQRWTNIKVEDQNVLGKWFLFQEGQWWGLLHARRGVVIPARLDDPHVYRTRSRTNKRQNCYFDTLGTVMCFEAYDDVFNGGEYFTLTRGNHVFVANKKGELIINDSFDVVDVLSHNHFYFKKDSIQGFYSGKGELFCSTSQPIENQNYRMELMPFNSNRIVIVGGNKWGYLKFFDENLSWVLKPEFDTIFQVHKSIDAKSRMHRKNFYKAIGSNGKIYFVDETNHILLASNSDKVDFRLYHIGESETDVEYQVFYLKDKTLYEYSSETGLNERVAKANDFEVFHGQVFVKMRKRWFHFVAGTLLPLKAQNIYLHSANNVFVGRKKGIALFDPVSNEFSNEQYNEIFLSDNQVNAIDLNGRLVRFISGAKAKLEHRFEVISQSEKGLQRFGIYDTPK
ncbi:MAG: WG repeat-containing protein [Bacteroidia bacterium]